MTEPSTEHDPSNVAEDVLRALRRIMRGVAVHSRQLYRSSGLTMPQLLCLQAIATAPGPEVTAAHVSRQLRLSPATVTGILDRLERDTLLRRERTSRDRRKICLQLTDRGRARLAEVSPSLQDRFVDRLRHLAPPERLAILAALERVAEMVGAADLDASPILDVAAPDELP